MGADSLSRLPLELLQMVASYLDDTASISRLCRSNRHLFEALGEYLYRYDAVLASGERCKALQATVAEESTLNIDSRVSIARKSLEAGADANFCVDFYFSFPTSRHAKLPWTDCCDYGSILSAAVARGCLPLVQVLVGSKADINRRTEVHGTAPIAIAMLTSWTDVFLFLLRQPAIDLSASTTGHFRLGSVLHIAVSTEHLNFVKMLVPYVNSEIADGPAYPLLWIAVLRCNSAMVSFLLSCENLDVNALRKGELKQVGFLEIAERKSTVFVYTCWHGTLDMVKLLHDHSRVDVDLCDEEDDPKYPPARAAMEAVGGGPIVNFLIESSKCKTARDYVFRRACAEGKIELARKVVRLAEDHDKIHAKSWTAMAELCSLSELARSIRLKWGDV